MRFVRLRSFLPSLTISNILKNIFHQWWELVLAPILHRRCLSFYFCWDVQRCGSSFLQTKLLKIRSWCEVECLVVKRYAHHLVELVTVLLQNFNACALPTSCWPSDEHHKLSVTSNLFSFEIRAFLLLTQLQLRLTLSNFPNFESLSLPLMTRHKKNETQHVERNAFFVVKFLPPRSCSLVKGGYVCT